MRLIHKLLALSLGPLIVSLVATTLTVSWIGIQIIRTEVTSRAELTLSLERARMAQTLSGVTTLLTAISRDDDIRDGTLEEALTALKHWQDVDLELMARWQPVSDNLEGLYFNELDGTVHPATGPSFDVSDRPYFPKLRQGELVISDAIVSRATGRPILLVVVPIYDRAGNHVAALGGTLLIEDVIQRVATISVGETGFAVLTDGQGNMVGGATDTSPTDGFFQPLTEALQQQGYGALTQAMVTHEPGTINLELNDEACTAYFQPIPSLPWSLALVYKDEELFAPVRRIQWAGVLILAISVAAIAFAALQVNRIAVRPLRALERAMRATAPGGPSVRAPVVGDDEFSDLSKTFNQLADDLEAYNARLETELEQRLMAEKSLKASESLLRGIIANSNAAIFVKDLDGRRTLVNREYARQLGMTEEECAGKADEDLFSPDEAEQIRKNDLHVLRQAQPAVVEEEIQNHGETQYYLAVKFPLFDESGAPVAVCGISTNITARKQAELDLQRSDVRFRSFIANTTDAVWCLECTPPVDTGDSAQAQTLRLAESTVIECNDVFAQACGLRQAEEAVEKPLRELAGSNLAQVMTLLMRFVNESYALHNAISYDIHVNTARRHLSHRVRGTVENGALVRVWGTFSDITEQVEAERALRTSEERFRAIAEQSLVGIWALQDGRFVFVNRAVCEMTGYPEPVMSQWDERQFLSHVHSDDRDEASRIVGNPAGTDVLDSARFRFISGTNEMRWLSVQQRGLTVNRKTLWVAVVVDETAGKLEELRRRSLEDQMRQSQRLESLGVLAGGIAHDFNNILLPIVGNAELVLDSFEPNDSRKVYISEILSAASRAGAMIQQILRFSRQTDSQKVEFDAREMLEEALGLLRATLPSSVRITTEFPAEEARILADPNEFIRVIVNLATNAFQAMEASGGQFTARISTVVATEAHVAKRPRLQLGQAYVVVEIHDTGEGIAPDQIDRVFDPFFTTKPPGKGTGLGLATVHGIVMELDGDIAVESDQRTGTAFTLYFPREMSQLQIPVPDKASIGVGAGERIAVIDDEEPVLRMQERVLTKLGYAVETFEDPVLALETIHETPGEFQLVITDLTMPEINGLEVTRRIRALASHLPVVLCTGLLDEERREALTQIPLTFLLTKPFTVAQLSDLLERALRESLAAKKN